MFREMFTENLEVMGWSNCCNSPIYTPSADGIGICSHCGEWAEILQIEEDEDE